MGLFDKKKSQIKVTEPGKIYAPVTGKYIPITDIPDEVFFSRNTGTRMWD